MSLGAVGPVGIGAPGAAIGTAMSAAGDIGVTQPSGAGGAASTDAIVGDSNPVTSLAELEVPALDKFDVNSIDLLIALLLMTALRDKYDDGESTGSTAFGFLTGLALAGALGRTDFNFQTQFNPPVDPLLSDALTGGQLNVTV